jgi:signal transduction histidine kinase
MIFDVAVVVLITRSDGGFASELYLGFVLVSALHAFAFGVPSGVAAAIASALGYVIASGWPPPLPEFAIRIGFVTLAAVSMGLLAGQARRTRDGLQRQQEHLLRSDRLATVGELAAGLAHELRNPLAGISGALHVLATHLEPADERRTLLADLQAQIARMNQTLTDLLRHARQTPPRRITAEVNTLLEQTLTFVPRTGVDVVRRFDPSLPQVSADPDLLHQAFLNIVINARQAMPQGGRLTVESRADGRNGRPVRITISDTGAGIPPDHLDRIFQPFFTTKPNGTGLGLAIAARIVEQHGGRIAVNTAPGEGTTFTIALPAAPLESCWRGEDHAVPTAGR